MSKRSARTKARDTNGQVEKHSDVIDEEMTGTDEEDEALKIICATDQELEARIPIIPVDSDDDDSFDQDYDSFDQDYDSFDQDYDDSFQQDIDNLLEILGGDMQGVQKLIDEWSIMDKKDAGESLRGVYSGKSERKEDFKLHQEAKKMQSNWFPPVQKPI